MKYDKEFKEEAVHLSDEIGSKSASEKLGVPYHTLAGWRRSKRQAGEYAFVGSGHKIMVPGMTEKEQKLEKENRELKRANDILKDALFFFAQDRKR